MKKRSRLVALAAAFLTVLAVVFGATSAFAAAGDVPEHDKVLTAHEDGTFTIALNVTGDAEKVTEPVNTNVIVILDTSGSMDENTGNTEETYTPSNQNANNMYGTNDGGQTFFPIYRRGNAFIGYTYYTAQVGGTQYTGQRYTRQVANQTRLEAAQDAINDLAETLLSKNGQDGNPNDLIQMALVTFASDANIARTPTTSLTQFEAAVNNTNANGGTNWEAGLRTANNVNFNDDDQTFVIFVSDGNPTYYINDQTGQRGGTGQEQTANINTSYNQAVPAAQTLANKVTPANFFTIGAYGNVDRMESLTTAAGAPAANYFSAENTAALQEALASILEKIEMAGIAEVEIEDGTTSNVTTTSGDVSNLLTVDEDSYKYYRAGGTDDEGNELYDSTQNDGLGEEWTDAPAATFEDGAVKWNIEGLLENDVTYTVTFDCWPSQTTLDIVADLRNDPSSYDSLDPNIQKYIDEEGNLKTNTTASISYTDTRTGESNSEEYENPDPVTTTAVEQLAVSKEWTNYVDSQGSADITLDVTRDGTHKYDLTLSEDNNWSGNVYISIGIMRTGDNGEMEILAEGHDFTFEEPGDIGYRWELDIPVVRPMLIDGELTMLIKVDEAHPAPEGADVYTIKGAEYYADEADEAKLTATNYRRSQLVLTKEVDGEGYPEDTTFPFTLTVTNSKANEGSADNLNSDYYVWFTTIDANGDNTNEVTVTGATAEAGAVGWYHVPSGTPFTVDLPAGYSVRFINLPKGSTYSFAEGTLASGFRFVKAELTTGEDEEFVGAQTSTGTVVDWNSEYVVTYTNKYELVNVTVTKVWDDASDQDGKRPDELELTLNGLPAGTTAPTPEITKSSDGNTWTYTWKGLPKYDEDGEEIEYTVSEDEVPEGYECTGSPADPGDTIINTHTPETIEATVEKEWDDAEDQDGIRPTSVDVNLLADGAVVESATLDESTEWAYTWEGLSKYGSGGKEITYTVEEVKTDVITGANGPGTYSYAVTGSVDAGFTVTNTHTPETVDVDVTKEWDDADDQDGIRPESIKVQLLADNEPSGDPVEITEAEDGTWTYTWEGLPKYAGGEEIEYTVKEVTDSVITGEDGPGTYAYEVSGTLITNKHTPETTEIVVKKVWEDEDDIDGLRPTSVAVNLLADGKVVDSVTVEGEDWTYTWTGKPKYQAGNEIKYTVEEAQVPDGYEATVDGLTITNTHKHETTTVTVNKVWEDEDDIDGLRPESVEVNLLADGKVVESATLDESTDWAYTWDELDKYADGKEITYTVEEAEVPDGYEATVDGLTITNTHVHKDPEPVWSDPPVEKIVVGDPETDATFTFQMVAVTEGAPMPEGASDGAMTCQITGSGSHEFGKMYYYEPGEYVYELSEVDDGVEGYTYDTTRYTLTVLVEADEDGNLTKTETVVDDSGNEVDHAVFTNVYEKEEPPAPPKPKPPAPKPPAVPKTGDETPSVGWIALLGAGLVAAGVLRRRMSK